MNAPDKPMRKLRLKVTFEVDYQVPADWDDNMALFHLNESSFCTNTLLVDKLRQSDAGGECACFPYETEIVPPETYR